MENILFLLFCLILLFTFIFSLKFWLKKKRNSTPIILYWILGIFFVFMIAFALINSLLMQIYHIDDHLTRDTESVNTISSLIGLAIYLFVGIKYFKRKKSLK